MLNDFDVRLVKNWLQYMWTIGMLCDLKIGNDM